MGCASSSESGGEAEQLTTTNGVSIPDFLAGNNYFSHLSKNNLTKAAGYFTTAEFSKGDSIMAKGSKSDSIMIVVSGRADVITEAEESKEAVLKSLERNDLIGEFGVINNLPRTLTVVAAEDTVVIVLSADKFNAHKDSAALERFNLRMKATSRDIMTTSLKNVEFLSNITDEQKQLVGKLFKTEFIPKGKRVFEEGQQGSTFYVLDAGKLIVHSRDEYGFPVELSRLKAGTSFGEISLLEDVKRTASVTALEESVLFSLDRESFEKFLALFPLLDEEMKDKVRERAALQYVTRDIPFVKSLDKNKLHKLADVCLTKRYRPGVKIVEEGKVDPLVFFIITAGYVNVSVGGNKVRSLGVGDYFGEVSLVSTEKHTATVTAAGDENVLCLECSKEDFENLFYDEPSVLAEVNIKVNKDKVELDQILLHPMAKDYFLQHCEKEFSMENVEFWTRLNSIETIANRVQKEDMLAALRIDMKHHIKEKNRILSALCTNLVQEFVVDSSSLQINLKSDVKAKLVAGLEAGTLQADDFATSKSEIYRLMETDNFNRFKSSALFTKLLTKLGAYQNEE